MFGEKDTISSCKTVCSWHLNNQFLKLCAPFPVSHWSDDEALSLPVMHWSYILFAFYRCCLAKVNTSPANKVEKITWAIENTANNARKSNSSLLFQILWKQCSDDVVDVLFDFVLFFLPIHLVFLLEVVQVQFCLITKPYYTSVNWTQHRKAKYLRIHLISLLFLFQEFKAN